MLLAAGCGGGSGPDGTTTSFYEAFAKDDAKAACAEIGGTGSTPPQSVVVQVLGSPNKPVEDPSGSLDQSKSADWDRGSSCEDAVSNAPEKVRNWAAEVELGEPTETEVNANVPVKLKNGERVRVYLVSGEEGWRIAGRKFGTVGN